MRKWSPGKTRVKEFAFKMLEIEVFCNTNNIQMSNKRDSYYFTLNGKKYRVSNHTREASNYNSGKKYHDIDNEEFICITAGKTRIIQIYNDLKNGFELNDEGYRIL